MHVHMSLKDAYLKSLSARSSASSNSDPRGLLGSIIDGPLIPLGCFEVKIRPLWLSPGTLSPLLSPNGNHRDHHIQLVMAD